MACCGILTRSKNFIAVASASFCGTLRTQIGASVQGQTPGDRARALAAHLDKFFNTDPAPFDVRIVNVLDRWAVVGGQTPLFEVTPQDAEFAKGCTQAVAEELRAQLARVLSAAPYYKKF